MSEYGLIINGKKVACENSFAVLNPANEEVVANCPSASQDQLNDAVKAAAAAFKSWSQVSEVSVRSCASWGPVHRAIHHLED